MRCKLERDTKLCFAPPYNRYFRYQRSAQVLGTINATFRRVECGVLWTASAEAHSNDFEYHRVHKGARFTHKVYFQLYNESEFPIFNEMTGVPWPGKPLGSCLHFAHF